MLRVSVTTLEKYRRFMAGVSSFDTEEALIETLKGEFTGNDKTKVGGAFHKIIETPLDYKYHEDVDLIEFEGIGFTVDQVKVAVKHRSQFPNMIHEVPVFKIYEAERMKIMITGRIDGINGREIRDAKTKFRSPDWSEYINSYQWRYYLDILNLDVFYYDLFEVRGFKELSGAPPYSLPGVQFIPHEPLRCVRYLKMKEDCINLLNSFLDYIENRQFYQYLKEARAYEDSIL